MNKNHYCFFDFETGGLDTTVANPPKDKNGKGAKKTGITRSQVTEIGAVIIDGRRLEIIPEGVFQADVRPIFDEDECKRLDIEVPQEDALKKSHKTREQLEKAPDLKTVWPTFHNFVKRFHVSEGRWGAPIKAGFNNDKFDNVILDGICRAHGPRNTKKGFEHEEGLFKPRDTVDLMRIFFNFTENMSGFQSISMDTLRNWLGLPTNHGLQHLADVDCVEGAQILCHFLRLQRKVASQTQFVNTMKDFDIFKYLPKRKNGVTNATKTK